MNKKRVVVSGLFFGITAMLEYIVRALKRRDDVEVLTIGSYTGTSIAWGAVPNLPEKYIFPPDIQLPALGIGSSVPVEFLESQLKLRNFNPDLYINVNAGFWFAGKLPNCKSAMLVTDPHAILDVYNQTLKNYDYIFNSQLQYPVNGEAVYLPYAYDPKWHYPEESVKEYDVLILGNHYQQRVELINRLQSQGKRALLKLGLKGDDARDLYNKSIISVNWSSLNDLTARVFETMGNGTILLANRVPDLMSMFVENEDFYGFSTIEEANVKVDYILSHLDEAYQVAKNGHNKVKDDHTWDKRVQTIMEVTGLI